jgi:hypothetical protein
VIRRRGIIAVLSAACLSLLTIACALAGLTSLALATAASSTVSDFNASHGKFTFQLKQSGKRFTIVAFSLACSSETYAEAKPKLSVRRSGAYSYSGPASLVTKSGATKTTLKASGKISFGKAHTLTSAKTATGKASITAAGCPSFRGKLKGYLLPALPGG